jgi:drug/metabolite transporter (DMT)-like permease
MLLIGGAFGLYRINLSIFATVCVICAGVTISSYGEMDFNILGIIIQCAGIGSEAIRLALSELLLSPSGIKMDPLTALYHFAPVCMVFCLLAAAIVEGPYVFLDSVGVWGVWMLLGNCVVAFGLNLSAVFLIRHTSSLTLTVCGIPKAVLTMVVSTQFWGERISLVQLLGFMIASAGVVHYSQLDIRKDKGTAKARNEGVEDKEEEGELLQDMPRV